MTLISFSGLPGVGKTTIARAAAQALSAVFLRIDSIEQAMRNAGSEKVGYSGYAVAYALAEENLRCGLTVVADCVNGLAVTRDAFAAAAERTGVPLVEVEVICSDARKHLQRVVARSIDIAGLAGPTWSEIQSRTYDAWTRPRLVLDTAVLTADESTTRVIARHSDVNTRHAGKAR